MELTKEKKEAPKKEDPKVETPEVENEIQRKIKKYQNIKFPKL